MTEQEFLEIVSLHAETYYKTEKGHHDFYDEQFGYIKRKGKLLKDIDLDDCLCVKWMTGGIGGGSCWNDNNDCHYSRSTEQEPDLFDLEVILEKICPQLTHIDYKKMLYQVSPPLIEYGNWTLNEYYGNETCYGWKKVKLKRLWERLQGLGVV